MYVYSRLQDSRCARDILSNHMSLSTIKSSPRSVPFDHFLLWRSTCCFCQGLAPSLFAASSVTFIVAPLSLLPSRLHFPYCTFLSTHFHSCPLNLLLPLKLLPPSPSCSFLPNPSVIFLPSSFLTFSLHVWNENHAGHQ